MSHEFLYGMFCGSTLTSLAGIVFLFIYRRYALRAGMEGKANGN
jgi:hypothetical protein